MTILTITTIIKMTLSKATLSKVRLSITIKNAIIIINADCCCTEFCIVTLNVEMPSVVMPRVMAPF